MDPDLYLSTPAFKELEDILLLSWIDFMQYKIWLQFLEKINKVN